MSMYGRQECDTFYFNIVHKVEVSDCVVVVFVQCRVGMSAANSVFKIVRIIVNACNVVINLVML